MLYGPAIKFVSLWLYNFIGFVDPRCQRRSLSLVRMQRSRGA